MESVYESVCHKHGIVTVSFDTVTVEFVQDLRETNALNKQGVVDLALSIGITTVSYTKNRLYEVIESFIINRDILISVRRVLSN